MVFCCGSSYHFGSMSQKLTVLRQKVSAASSKMHFTFSRKKVEEKIVFFSKKQNVIFCLGYSARKILVMDEKFMVALLDLLSTCLANMSRILDKLNNLSNLSGFEQNEVGLLVENFPQDCRNYIIRVQKIFFIFEKKFTLWKKNFPKVVFGSRV